MTTDLDAKRAKIAKLVKKAREKEKRAPLSTEEKYRHSLKMGSRVVPEMPSRIGWSSVGCYGYGTVEVLRGEMDYRFWRVALVVAAKILENPEALKIESVADLEKRERELQECLTDDQKKAGLQVIVRPVVSFPLKYAQDVLQLKNLRERELAAAIEAFASVRLKVTQFKGLRLKEWVPFSEESGDIASVVLNRTTGKGKRGRGRGQKQPMFTLAFHSRIGLAFYHNLCRGGATLLKGATKLLRAPDGYQRLIFNLCTSGQDAIIQRDKLLALVGMEKSDDPDYYRHQLSRLRSYVKRGIAEGYFVSLSRLDGGTWTIKKQWVLPFVNN
jgi:hypothetical protein